MLKTKLWRSETFMPETLVKLLIFCTLIGLKPLQASALDCAPPSPEPLDNLGLFDVDTWICPVENMTAQEANNGSEDWATLRYQMRVLDTRACPVEGFQVEITGTRVDPTPRWPRGQTFFLFLDAVDQESIASTERPVILSNEDCDPQLDRIQRSVPVLQEANGTIDDDTVLFRPANAEEADEEVAALVVAEDRLFRVRDGEVARDIRWSEILEIRGQPAATGTNFAGHDAVCPTRLRRGTECEFDTDCATCHDGSDCGTVTTRQSVIDGGETCRLPDAAECESYRERCCNGHCTAQSY